MKQIIIISLFCLSIIYSKEQIFYTAKFKNMNAGSAVLETKKDPNQEIIELQFYMKTRKFIDVFYKLRDQINAFIDFNNQSLKSIKKISEQGKYKKIDEAKFDYKNNVMIFDNRTLEIKNPVYDPLSIITYLRNQKLNMGQNFSFDIYSSGEIKNINLEVMKEETIKIKNKEYQCFVIGYSLHDQSEITLWIDKGKNQLPIIIETKGKNGSVILKYKSHQVINES